jgi:poly(3-hydroxybutyrate) depolymerase
VTARLAAVALAVALSAAASSRVVRAEGPDPAQLLAAAVDQPTAKARAAAALRLAERADVSLDAWLAAMRGFGGFERVAPGSRTEKAALDVGDAREEATVAVYVPKGYAPDKPAPLLLALHGAGGEGHDEDELWTQAAEALGMLVVAPTDPSADLGLKYGETARQRALAALRWARRRFDVDENRVFLTGVSRGGHLAWDIVLREPDLFAAAVPMIGAPRLTNVDGQNNLRYVENVVQLPIRDLQGAQDDPVLLKNLKIAFDRLKGFGARDAQLVLSPDIGHDFDPHAVDWVKFLGSATRQSVPLRVVRACARADEARSFWAEATRFAAGVDEKFRADIDASKLKAMDDDAKRAWFQSEADKRTARLDVRFDGPGKFTAQTSLVQRFRLLLTPDMFDPAAGVDVTTDGKLAHHDVKPSKLVLLREFVERFDRTFLPVAEVSCP